MNRRDFFLLGSGRTRVLEVACERLYMNYLDAQIDGTTGQLLKRMGQESRRARKIRFRDPFWLDREDLKRALEPLLAEFLSRGGSIEYV